MKETILLTAFIAIIFVILYLQCLQVRDESKWSKEKKYNQNYQK